MRRIAKRSEIWEFCTKLSDNSARCNVCRKEFKYSGNTSNLRDHLRRKHPGYLGLEQRNVSMTVDNNTREHAVPSTSNGSSKSVQLYPPVSTSETPVVCNNLSGSEEKKSSETVTFRKPRQTKLFLTDKKTHLNDSEIQAIDKCLVKMVAIDLQPLSVVENIGFIQYSKQLQPLYELPSRKNLTTKLIPNAYSKIRLQLEKMLEQVKEDEEHKQDPIVSTERQEGLAQSQPEIDDNQIPSTSGASKKKHEDYRIDTAHCILKNDVGVYLNNTSKIDDFTRIQLLTNHWTPDIHFQFRISLHTRRGREERRRPNIGHLEKHEWLVLSKEKMGLFCKYCVLFSNSIVGGRHVTSHNVAPQKLVKIPLTTFAKLSGKDGDLILHEKTKYHLECSEKVYCCGQEILSTIGKIRESQLYSIIFDETTDISNRSQLSVSVRFVHKDQVEEKFLGFVDLHAINYNTDEDTDLDNSAIEPKITGTILGQSVIRLMQTLDLDLSQCIGIGCDNCSVNMSKVKGAAYEIQKHTKNAKICPCYNHNLNLVLSQSLKVQSVNNANGTIQEIVSFFQQSAKRNFILMKHLKCKLKSPCQTRWVERHDSILQFVNDLPSIVQALLEITDWDDSTSSSKANILTKAICDCEFILAIYSLRMNCPYEKERQRLLRLFEEVNLEDEQPDDEEDEDTEDCVETREDSDTEQEGENEDGEEFESQGAPYFTAKDEAISPNYQRSRDARPTNLPEIKALFGLLYLAGIHKSSRLNTEELWSRDGTGIDLFWLTMSLQRFRFLMRVIRTDNKNTREERCKKDKLAPIRDIFDSFVQNCQKSYTICEYATVDEKLEAFRGRCSFRQYIPSKPNKYGIKIFALVDSKMYYTCNLEVYVGQQPEGEFRQSNDPKSVVLRLIMPITKTGRNITVDNWFTSYELINELLKKHNLTLVGTMRKNKRQLPVEFVNTKQRPVNSSMFAFEKIKRWYPMCHEKVKM
ncbi:unnamed protein product [Callosobruchus maculatus]|uniref:BED-type domain-containing protein n=1 Tax=Callosobruchus maculatus TaxID=64391 RepID=A0A653D040_CALMS|nr:unnamed protein product [Callosobruchus maculatus]